MGVVPIAIGEYSTDHRDRKRAGVMLSDLRGIRKDIANVVEYFHGELRYDIYPNYHGQNEENYKVNWKRDELIQLLQRQSTILQQNLENEDITDPSKYDGLIVLISCHGMEDRVWTSDYRTITKEMIHRTFSSFPI